MAEIFNSVQTVVPKKNKFKLGHNVKLTFEMGQLIPFYVQDVLPNDSIKLSVQNLIRFAPLLAPIMSEVDVYIHFFYVPYRLIWTKWEDFITGAHNGKILTPDEVPSLPVYRFMAGGLSWATNDTMAPYGEIGCLRHRGLLDYLGFQSYKERWNQGGTYEVDALPIRAYQKIWSDWYKDENLTYEFDDFEDVFNSSGGVNIDSTSPNPTVFTEMLRLRRRAWKKDYFTSALPFAQKGDDVLIPSGSGTGSLSRVSNLQGDFLQNRVPKEDSAVFTSPALGNSLSFFAQDSTNSNSNIRLNLDNLNVNVDVASDATIRELWRAIAAQKFLQRRAVGGSRYIEQNLAFFGARSSDARLQRSEFLGGCKNPVVVSQLLQTSQTTEGNPLGTPAGNAVSAGGDFICKRTFEEYGFVMGILSVMPKADYIQGIPKMFLRRDPYDFYWPQFAKIGEQPIQNQELFFSPLPNNTNEDTFGYTPRYAEYRFRNNRVCGDFKDTLKFWTLARDFDSVPNLNQSFIECNPSKRIFAVEDTDFSHLWAELSIQADMLRPLPKYGENI